jgi:hypothetical protein
MTVKFLDILEGELTEAAWQVYRSAFEELNALAAQRHLMYRSEFDGVMSDPRVDKVLTLDDAGALAGIATITRDLDAVPLIAPPFFARRWPQQYAQRRIWYIGFVAVAPAAQGGSAFTDAFNEYYRIAEAEDGLVGMDICAHNELAHRLPRAIQLQLRRLSGGAATAERVDTQSFWMFDMRGRTL